MQIKIVTLFFNMHPVFHLACTLFPRSAWCLVSIKMCFFYPFIKVTEFQEALKRKKEVGSPSLIGKKMMVIKHHMDQTDIKIEEPWLKMFISTHCWLLTFDITRRFFVLIGI